MSALRIRRQLRRHRRDVALIATLLVLAALIAVHHSGVGMDMHQHAGMGAVIQMCLGVITAISAGLVAGALTLGAHIRDLTLDLLPAAALPVGAVLVARARHGPAVVSVLCVSRR